MSAVALVLGVLIGLYQVGQEAGTASKSTMSPVAGMSLGGGFSLIDHNGQAVTEADYAGKYQLIYFGFTYCPAICPTELQKITQVLKKLEPEQAEKIQPLFITIDPERDTPAVMKEYVALFHDRLVGLSGSVEQIEQVKKDYRIYATKVPDPDSPDDYTMDHSSYIYFMDPQGQLVGLYSMRDKADEIVSDIQARL